MSDQQDQAEAAAAAATTQPDGGSESKQAPSRHPILARLENNDYDFTGQSLDYEPNLEFDDTDLKEELEEELEQLSAADFLASFGAHQPELAAPTAGQEGASSSSTPPTPGRPQSASSSGERLDEGAALDEAQGRDENIFLDHLQAQHQRQPYLESPHDLLEENFEEAFKSGLFELEQSGQRAKQASKNKLMFAHSARGQKQQSSGGGLSFSNFFNKSAGSNGSGKPGSGFYVNKQSLLNDSLEELKLSDYDSDDDFSDIAQFNCVEVAGDDLFGRRIITIYACRLPSATKIHHLRLLKYIMYTLDQYVENDYCVVYFHYGLSSHNKPKLNFLYQAYKAFDRKYKKNLKALFLVHPTNFIRIVWQLFKPIIR